MPGKIKLSEMRALPLTTLQVLALSVAHDIDNGADSRDLLEAIFGAIRERSLPPGVRGRPPARTPLTARPRAMTAATGAVCAATLCLAAWALAVNPLPPTSVRGDLPLAVLDTAATLSWRTEPAEIVVRLVPRADVPRLCGNAAALACADTVRRPCLVIVPAGEEIMFQPRTNAAAWAERSAGNHLAHEFLHCFYPNWHAPFDAAVAAARRMNHEEKP